MSARVCCPVCDRPQRACYCRFVQPVATRTRVLILQHPRESRVAINTARIARLCLPSAEIHVGIAWDSGSEVAKTLEDPSRKPILLYPGPGARDIRELATDRPVTLVVVDGTWSQSRAVMRNSPLLAGLPRFAFVPDRGSEYRIRREPRPDYVSTIEALVHVLGVLEGRDELPDRLMRPFRAMVDFQLSCVEHEHAPRARVRPKHKERKPKLPSMLTARREDLVCVAGEANAWPRGEQAHPSELVHWLAYRPATGERFECIRAAEHPLSPRTPEHVGVDALDLRRGLKAEGFRQSWRAFVRDSDVLCSWGYFPLDLLRAAGGYFPGAHVDLRAAAKGWSGRRWTSVEHFHDEVVGTTRGMGRGRGGRNLGRVAGVTAFLVGEALRERGSGDPRATG